MAPGKHSKKCLKHECASEKETESTTKRKQDYGEVENEPLAKKLLVRKISKDLEKTGKTFSGSVLQNKGVFFCHLERQKNIVHYVYQNMLGGTIGAQLKKCLQVPFVRSLHSYRLFRTASHFDRRITCLEWHPTHPSTVAVGSKGGDIILWDYEVLNKACFIKGMGAGGAITGMKFNPFNPSELYTSSVAGTTVLQDFNGNTIRVFTSTNDWDLLQDYTVWNFVLPGDTKNSLEKTHMERVQLPLLPCTKGPGLTAVQECTPNTGSIDLDLGTVYVVSFFSAILFNGPGDFLGGIKFSPFELNKLYVASGDGTLRLQHLDGQGARMIICTPVCDHEFHDVCFWYCSVDVSAAWRSVLTGDNVGNVILLSTEGEKIWNLKLHKKKVTHVEFNSRCDWLMATASVDRTVKIWDLRNIKDKSSCLHVLPHDKPVNAAYFSPIDGAKLLSTDQYNEIRVYSSSDWSKPQHLIPHPHRQFQHLTPIKATWHPRYDLIVAGRYPDPHFPGYTSNELRTVDIFDGNSGEMVCQLHDSNASGIISLNKFNPMGDTLASGMGFNILIWGHEEMISKKQERLMQAVTEQGNGCRTSSRQGGPRNRQSETGTSRLKTKLKVQKT